MRDRSGQVGQIGGSGQQRPDDSACNRRPKLEADLIHPDHRSIYLTQVYAVTCPISLCMLTRSKIPAGTQPSISSMIQASFQALAHGNPHHAPTLNEKKESFSLASNLNAGPRSDQIPFPASTPPF